MSDDHIQPLHHVSCIIHRKKAFMVSVWYEESDICYTFHIIYHSLLYSYFFLLILPMAQQCIYLPLLLQSTINILEKELNDCKYEKALRFLPSYARTYVRAPYQRTYAMFFNH